MLEGSVEQMHLHFLTCCTDKLYKKSTCRHCFI